MASLIEKLEERLQKIQRSLKRGFDSEQIIALSSHESGFLTAFNIVKQHTCKWDNCGDAAYAPCCDIVFCYNQEDPNPDFIFCPYCGGKIQPPSEVQDETN